mgnify:CR=1 FL=1|jgi:hypothetical protein|tara:strand:+ start:183 stop:641 length:459 start_codon:yes stop_codon:yes gene_type:complete
MRIAGFEGLQGRWAFRGFIQQRAVDIVQPDIAIVGEFAEARKVVAIASAKHVRVLPHLWGSVVCMTATLHWQAAIPDLLDSLNGVPSYFECDITENGLRMDSHKIPSCLRKVTLLFLKDLDWGSRSTERSLRGIRFEAVCEVSSLLAVCSLP